MSDAMSCKKPFYRTSLFGAGLFLVFLSCTAEAKPANWEYSTDPVGGSGDIQNAAVCPVGEYVVGFAGRVGDWIDRIDLRCAPVLPAGQMGAPHTVGGDGGSGGAPATPVQCSTGVLRALNSLLINGNRMVLSVNQQCTDPITGKSLKESVRFGAYQGSHPIDSNSNPQCPANMALTGLRLNWGKHVNAVGIVCGTLDLRPVAAAPPPKPIKTTGRAKSGTGGPASPPGMLVCHTGGAMKRFGTPQNDGSMLVTFDAAPQAANVALPGPGQCAWDVQTISPKQAKRLGLGAKVMAQLGDIQSDRIFKVHAIAMTAFLLSTGEVEIVSDGALAAAEAAVGGAAQGGDGGEPAGGIGGMAAGVGIPSAGCPVGEASVSTPAGIDFLNVREGPSLGATVIAQVPNGNTVTVSGSCINPAKGAGFAKQTLAPKQGGGDAGAADGPWCRISAPDPGCVSAKFLVFAGNGGVAAGLPVDPAKGAGFAKQQQGKAVAMGKATFKGRWDADADGVAYDLRLDQIGSVVKGSFAATDGSKGTILGNVSGKTLRFDWIQTNDGQTGSGKFVLASDGRSFSGSYNFQVDSFDKVEGNWSGTRR